MSWLCAGSPSFPVKSFAEPEKSFQKLVQVNLVGEIAFEDYFGSGKVSYFTPFRPLDGVSDIANGVVIILLEGDPTVFTLENVLVMRGKSFISSEELRRTGEVFSKTCTSQSSRRDCF